MTLVDVARTGRRFKRSRMTYWFSLDSNSTTLALTQDDILATDWQVEEPKPRMRVWCAEGTLKFTDKEPNCLRLVGREGIPRTVFWEDVTEQLKELLK